MIRKPWLPFVLLLCSLSAFPQADKPIITVLDFTVNEVSQAEMRSIISLLSSSLFKTNNFTVIDVSQRDTVLKEMEFSMSGCTDESCMLEVGKLLSAEAIVIGSIGRVGSKYVLSTKMLETETARTLSTADGIYGDLDALLEDIFSVAAELGTPYEESVAAAPVSPEVAVEPEPEPEPVKPKPVKEPRPPREPREPGEINIPAVATLAGGVASLGTGVVFLVLSLPLISTYLEAKKVYEAADLSSDVTALWNDYEAARVAAVEGKANTNFIIGAACTGTGLALGVVSAVLFTRNPEAGEPAVSAAFLPLPGCARVSFRVRF